MPGCAVANCGNNERNCKGRGITFHRIPKDEVLKKAWIQACNRGDNFNGDNSKICSIHFTQDDFERDLKAELMNFKPKQLLKPRTIPSLNIPTVIGESDIIERVAKSKKRKNSSNYNNSRLVRIQTKTECSEEEEEDDPSQPVSSFDVILPEREGFKIYTSLLKSEPEDPSPIDDSKIHEAVDDFAPPFSKYYKILPKLGDNDQTTLKTVRQKEHLAAIGNVEKISCSNEVILARSGEGDRGYNYIDNINGNVNVEDEDRAFLLSLLNPMKKLTASQKNEFKTTVLCALENLRAQCPLSTTNTNDELNSSSLSHIVTGFPLNNSYGPIQIPIESVYIKSEKLSPELPTSSVSDINISQENKSVNMVEDTTNEENAFTESNSLNIENICHEETFS